MSISEKARVEIAKGYLKPDELEVAPLREDKALQLLSPLDIAPGPIFYEPSVGPIVVCEFMEGEMWDRRPVNAIDLSKPVYLYLAIFPIFWLTVIIKRGIQLVSIRHLGEWKINGLPGNERLRRCLARGAARAIFLSFCSVDINPF